MPLLLDNIRAEFARFLAEDPTARFRMDSALAHVATAAYQQGLQDGNTVPLLPASIHSAAECSAAFEWLRTEATKDGASEHAGVALDELHALATGKISYGGTPQMIGGEHDEAQEVFPIPHFLHHGQYVDLDLFPLPTWAERHSDGNFMERGVMLATKDGRRFGNCYVDAIETHESLGQIAVVVSDMGNVFRMTIMELEEAFYPPVYVMNLEEARVRRGVATPFDEVPA